MLSNFGRACSRGERLTGWKAFPLGPSYSFIMPLAPELCNSLLYLSEYSE
ncbi:hypothetical protein HMPREF0322_02948 [Desulfitobacterium hafniense DP7]|uniref:Uncharacterized protein n=1 Tax=Desulfitobacterium hafniense DP7 TaxID=537010 RepID=G9XPQ2_DESHA|nr:hypothetical protein HMPREF0322_02948 [Desulfitobacterium hafniense DP7]